MTVEQIARVCHEANRAYALSAGEDPTTLHPSWDAAPEEIRESARVGVKHALEGATPETLHESWMESKRSAGWVYGQIRNNAAKVHPCMVPYSELPAAQRVKDALFMNVVETLR